MTNLILNSDDLRKIDKASSDVIEKIKINVSELATLLSESQIVADGETPEAENEWDHSRIRYLLKVLTDPSSDESPLQAVEDNAIARTRLVFYIKYLLDREQELTPADLRVLLSDPDYSVARDYIERFTRFYAPLQFPTPLDINEDSYVFADVYSYLVPRLVEQILSIYFKKLLTTCHVVIPLELSKQATIQEALNVLQKENATANEVLKYIDRALVASVNQNGTIYTSIKGIPFLANDSRILSFIRASDVKDITSVKDIHLLAFIIKKDIAAEERRELTEEIQWSVLKRLVKWLVELARERATSENSVHVRYTAMVRTNSNARLLRLNHILDWVIKMANMEQKSWEFAVALYPEHVKAPRYHYLETIAYSSKAPYKDNPQRLKDEGFSYFAYQNAQVVCKNSEIRGTVEPIKYERPVQSLIAVPTVTTDHINGVLYIASHMPDQFDDSDELLLALVGQIVSELLSNSVEHRSDNTNIEQILDNPRILSTQLSLFRARKDLENTLEQLLHHTTNKEEIFVITIVDLDSSKALIEQYPNIFNDQRSVDTFFQNLGAKMLQPIIDECIGKPDDKLMEKTYQLLIDRFVYLRRWNPDKSVPTDTAFEEIIDKCVQSIDEHTREVVFDRRNDSIIEQKITFGIGSILFQNNIDKSATELLRELEDILLRQAKRKNMDSKNTSKAAKKIYVQPHR